MVMAVLVLKTWLYLLRIMGNKIIRYFASLANREDYR